MSVIPYDPNERDDDVLPVVTELEADMAFAGYVVQRLETVVEMMDQGELSSPVGEELADTLAWVRGQHTKLRGEIMRLRQPDS